MIAIGVFAYLAIRPVAPLVHRGFRQRVRRVRLLGMAVTAPLALAVMSDGALTSIQLMRVELSAGSLVPFVTMALEIACIAILSLDLARTASRAAIDRATPRTSHPAR
jgi:hypothetical protein